MIYILDASAIISGVEAEGEAVTTPDIAKEIKEENLRLKLELAIKEGRLKILTPGEESLEKVKRASEATGDSALLSRADMELLALALELGKGSIVVTDDYAVQNLAEVLGLKYLGIKEKGIEKVFIWRKVCKSCGREYPIDYTATCEVCGGRVVKKVRKVLNKR